MRALASCLLALGLLVGCAGELPRRGAADKPSELIPASRFFANRESNYGYRLSPDGTKVGWIAAHQNRSTIFFRSLDARQPTILDTHSSRSIFGFRWAQDSRHVLYVQDRDGDENFRVYLADTEAPIDTPVDLTPWPSSRSGIHRVLRTDPAHVIIASNRRDRSIFDLYRVSLATREASLIAENPGDVTQWMTDQDGTLRARLRRSGTGQSLEVVGAGTWRAIRTLADLGSDFLPTVAQHIRSFRRVKVERGRTLWEITARDAQYFDKQDEIVVREPQMTFYLADGQRRARVSGLEGRLVLAGHELRSLTLRGDVTVKLDDLEVQTGEATYDRARDLITSPGPVRLHGRTLDVSGRGMEVDVTPQHVRLLDEVRTVLRSNAASS